MFSNSSRWIIWLFTGLLCCTATHSGPAEEKAALPDIVYLEQSGTTIRVDYSDYLQTRREFLQGQGCYQVVFSASVAPGADPSGLFSGHGIMPTLVREPPDLPGSAWSDIWEHKVCFDESEVTVEGTAGPDTVRLLVPMGGLLQSASGVHQEEQALVSVNHHSVPFSSAYVDQLAAAVASGYVPESLWDSPGMADLASHLNRDGWYSRTMPVVAAVQGVVSDHHVIPDPSGLGLKGCWKPCVNCAALSGGLLVALPAVAASCGATAGAGCVAGGVGIMRLAVGTVTSCSDCLECRRRDGGGGCKEGYHDCCEGHCCKDEDPPPDCGPE